MFIELRDSISFQNGGKNYDLFIFQGHEKQKFVYMFAYIGMR